jgi:uncharacterized coiled-coil DUF342 family protein
MSGSQLPHGEDMIKRDHEAIKRLNTALRRVVLLRETGPKSAAWHRARVQTIWRLHKQLEQEQATERQDERT